MNTSLEDTQEVSVKRPRQYDIHSSSDIEYFKALIQKHGFFRAVFWEVWVPLARRNPGLEVVFFIWIPTLAALWRAYYYIVTFNPRAPFTIPFIWYTIRLPYNGLGGWHPLGWLVTVLILMFIMWRTWKRFRAATEERVSSKAWFWFAYLNWINMLFSTW